MLLDEIIHSKHAEVAEAKQRLPLDKLQQTVAAYRSERSFKHALQSGPPIRLIAELKRKSPSKGMLRERFDPIFLAQEMQESGAHALSVLTDEPFFGGSLQFLRSVKQFTDIPLLRKDFVVDMYQIYEAAAFQADAVLLLACILDDAQITECLKTAASLGMDALVEIHNDEELQRALDCGAEIVGINHRDLRTFEMHMGLTERLVPKIPKDRVIVAESGIHNAEDVKRMRELGANALLIGESLMTAPQVGKKIRELFSAEWN